MIIEYITKSDVSDKQLAFKGRSWPCIYLLINWPM